MRAQAGRTTSMDAALGEVFLSGQVLSELFSEVLEKGAAHGSASAALAVEQHQGKATMGPLDHLRRVAVLAPGVPANLAHTDVQLD